MEAIPDSLPKRSTDAVFMTTQTLVRPTSARSADLDATPAKGWHRDPFGQHKLRFHDGVEWTQHTTHHGPVPCSGCHSLA